MPPTQNSSFIPKRAPNTKIRSSKKRSSSLVSSIISVFFGATVISAGALMAYEWYLNNQLTATTLELGQAAEGFSEADLERVLDFDMRLKESKKLFSQHISVNRALTALAQSTVGTVQFSGVSLSRTDRSNVIIDADVTTDDIGSVLAQRSVFQNSAAFSDVTFADLSLAFADPSSTADSSAADAAELPVGVTVALDLPVDAVLYEVTNTIDNQTGFSESVEFGTDADFTDTDDSSATNNFDI